MNLIIAINGKIIPPKAIGIAMTENISPPDMQVVGIVKNHIIAVKKYAEAP